MRWLGMMLMMSMTAAGCGVQAKSGTRDLPVDLRSSSDARRPAVGMSDGPATRPSALEQALGGARTLVIDIPRLAYERLTGKTMLDAAEKLGAEEADQRRDAIVRLVGRDVGKGLPYTDVYKSMAQIDADPLVRATAVRAINRSRDASATPALVQALKDGHPDVRLEAAKALANLPAAEAEAGLRAIMTNSEEPIDNRIAAADALRHYNNLDTQRALVAQMSNTVPFGVSWQARRSLYLMTGQDHRYDEAAWLAAMSSTP
jgi:hypothetical protein